MPYDDSDWPSPSIIKAHISRPDAPPEYRVWYRVEGKAHGVWSQPFATLEAAKKPQLVVEASPA